MSASFKATRPSQRTSRHIYDLNTFLQLQPIITQRLFPSMHCLMRYSTFFCFIFWEQWLRIFALNSMYNDTHCYLTKHPGTMICTDFSFHYLRVISQELQSFKKKKIEDFWRKCSIFLKILSSVLLHVKLPSLCGPTMTQRSWFEQMCTESIEQCFNTS